MRKCLKILGATHFKLPVKDRQFLPPTSLEMSVTHPKQETKQTSHLHSFTLHSFMSLTLTHPKKQRQTSHIHLYTLHSFMPLIFHLTQPQERKQTNLTFV
jgi:hypothetical protein